MSCHKLNKILSSAIAVFESKYLVSNKKKYQNLYTYKIRNIFWKKKSSTDSVQWSRNFTRSEPTNPQLSVGSCLKQQVLVNRCHVVAARKAAMHFLRFKSRYFSESQRKLLFIF